MNIATYRRPSNLDEAYDLVVKQGAYPLGGGAWSMSVGRPIASAVDLCDLGLRYIRVEGKNIAVGAMATARDLERSSLLADVFGPLFPEALGGIAGVQVRNIVTAGGSVAGRYGFSELLVVLLALDASLVFYNDGTRPLSEYLGAPRGGAFLLEKILLPLDKKASYQGLRHAATDFPVLSVCACRARAGWRIAVGARPGVAAICPGAGASLGSTGSPGEQMALDAGRIAAGELSFGEDLRAGAEYRRSVCSVLVARAIRRISYDS